MLISGYVAITHKSPAGGALVRFKTSVLNIPSVQIILLIAQEAFVSVSLFMSSLSGIPFSFHASC